MADSFLYSYDVAIRTLAYTRFGSILGINTLGDTAADSINQGVVLCPKGIARRWVAEKRGKTFLDFINIYRTQVAFSWKRQRTIVARRGLYATIDGNTQTLKANPVDLTYNMWFWSNSLDKINQCIEKYIQWQHDTPKVSLTYDDTYTLNPDLSFTPVIDESAIEDVFNIGKVWCFRMPLSVQGWIITSTTETGLIAKIRLTTYDKDNLESYTDIVVDGSNQDTELAAALRMFRANLYGIVDVDSTGKTFAVYEDQTADFTVGRQFIVENSTANNEMYTVVTSVYAEGTNLTTITVSETIVDETVDGNIYLPEN